MWAWRGYLISKAERAVRGPSYSEHCRLFLELNSGVSGTNSTRPTRNGLIHQVDLLSDEQRMNSADGSFRRLTPTVSLFAFQLGRRRWRKPRGAGLPARRNSVVILHTQKSHWYASDSARDLVDFAHRSHSRMALFTRMGILSVRNAPVNHHHPDYRLGARIFPLRLRCYQSAINRFAALYDAPDTSKASHQSGETVSVYKFPFAVDLTDTVFYRFFAALHSKAEW